MPKKKIEGSKKLNLGWTNKNREKKETYKIEEEKCRRKIKRKNKEEIRIRHSRGKSEEKSIKSGKKSEIT